MGADRRDWAVISPREHPDAASGFSHGLGGPIGQALSTLRDKARRAWEARHALVALLFGVLAWEVLGRLLNYSFLPPFSNVLRATHELVTSGQILGYLAASLVSLVVGYALAVSSGVTLGLMAGRYRWVEHVIEPYITGFLATPKIVFIPILFARFGVGRGTQVAFVFLSAFSIIVINTMGGLRGVDANCVEMARAFGASERQIFWKVLLPGALPLTMAGLRLAVGRAVKGMVKGEMFIALFGLGALLRKYGSRFDSAKVFAIVLMVVCVALICTFAVRTVERRLTRWTEVAS